MLPYHKWTTPPFLCYILVWYAYVHMYGCKHVVYSRKLRQQRLRQKHFMSKPFDPHESAMWKEVGEGGSDQAS